MRVHHSLIALTVATVVTAGGCHGRLAYNVPPAQQLSEPGPGVGGPGPGVIPPAGMGGMPGMPGMGGMMGMGGYDPAVMPAGYECGAACGSCCGDCCGDGMGYGGGMGYVIGTSQISFLGEEGVQISWDVSGIGQFDSVPIITPARQDFPQASIYRLKLFNIPGRPGVELYPTLEVAPVTPRTDAYLAHAPVPVQFSEEDFDQVLSGNFVTKVIYLPDPEFQELALAGVETLVSTRLDPGMDPIAEADRRGSILAILRIGNKDLERTGYSEEMGMVIPAAHQAGGNGHQASRIPTTAGQGGPGGNVDPAQYCYGGPVGGMSIDGGPLGMPTAGFAPPAVPPQMVMGGGQYGMPMSGTPIGLPGPPHIPLGGPAGLQKHVMKNRTRVLLPPPTSKVNISVKQRPGLNYPAPVNSVYVDETHREPARLFGGLFSWFGAGGGGGGGGQGGPGYGPDECY
jgi:hypothetical protein